MSAEPNPYLAKTPWYDSMNAPSACGGDRTSRRFYYAESRRNIITGGVELMDLIGKEFGIGDAVFRGHKYCDPCERPSKLAGVTYSFRDAFFDRDGLVAEIVQGGVIRINDAIVPPKKDY